MRRATINRDNTHFLGGFNLRYFDMIDMFLPEYDGITLKLLGKRAYILPYDSSDLNTPFVPLSQFVDSEQPPYGVRRYQKRMAWVVVAEQIDAQAHPISKRVFYVDTNSWEILLSEHYDANGVLKLVHECHLSYAAELQASLCQPQYVYSLEDRRYLIINKKQEEGRAPRKSEFTTFSLKN